MHRGRNLLEQCPAQGARMCGARFCLSQDQGWFFFLLGCLRTGHFSSQTEDIAAIHAVRLAGAPPVTFPWRIPRGPRLLPSGSRLAACPGHVLSLAPVCGPRFLCLPWRPASRMVHRRDTGCSFTDRVSENARHSHQTRLGGAESCAGGPPRPWETANPAARSSTPRPVSSRRSNKGAVGNCVTTMVHNRYAPVDSAPPKSSNHTAPSLK